MLHYKYSIDNQAVKSVPSVKLRGIYLDDQENLNLHINNIHRSASNQLNKLIRLKSYLRFNAKKGFNHNLHNFTL